MQLWFKNKFYDDLSDIRHESQGYYKHYVHNFFTHFFDTTKVRGKNILDFGCGPGFYSAILAQRGANVIGIDLSAFLIKKANEYKSKLKLSNIQFIKDDFLNFSLRCKPANYDFVIAIDTIVSFDANKRRHEHERAVAAFKGVNRVLKPDGKFFIIEAHPFFRKGSEVVLETQKRFYVRDSGYKIDYKSKSDKNHWFTLDEMTKSINEAGLAILRIYEPDPSIALKEYNAAYYSMRLRYPAMIVYEICKVKP